VAENSLELAWMAVRETASGRLPLVEAVIAGVILAIRRLPSPSRGAGMARIGRSSSFGGRYIAADVG
jgi:hypothetical protein